MEGKKRTSLDEIRARAEKDLFYFAKLINPHYMYGDIHRKVFKWLSNPDSPDNQLLLLPRAHLKSHCIAVWAVWQITRDPTTTMVYLSAGEDLAAAQVYAIKNMLLCDDYRLLWPEMINQEEGKRDKWSAWAINVDHPKRKEARVRDNTIIVKTIKANAAGLHCSHLVMDDVVVPNNAYTETGRKEVRAGISQFASIKNPGALTKAVGTIYHPRDLYNDFKEAVKPVINELGEILKEIPLWEVWEEKVEDRGDGTGNFLWPRIQSPLNHEWYGFNIEVLAQKKAEYFSLAERTQFFAQYYNEANDPDSNRLQRDIFQYYDARYLTESGGNWSFKGDQLRVFAAVDFAYTDTQTADYTAIAVIGVDASGYIYVLDLDRFKTTKYEQYYVRISEMHIKWGFKKIRVETNSGANIICEFVKDRIREEGLSFSLDGKNVTKKQGTKEQRIAALLEPRYENGDVWHNKSGLVLELEEELLLERPPHDDLKDALAAAVEISRKPTRASYTRTVSNIVYHPRFGGMVR